jgi:hypothetical protein
MQKAENKLNQQKKRNSSKKLANNRSIKPQKTKKKKVVLNPKGVKPDVTNLNVSNQDDPLQFDKIEKIDDRSMIQIQAGIADFKDGIDSLNQKNYKAAQKKLK